MSSEKHSWSLYRPIIKALDPQRLEDRLGLGVPDVNITLGWIENKHVFRWPVRVLTKLRIDHFTFEQRIWLTRRCEAGGAAWMMLHVSEPNEWLLFWGKVAAAVVGRGTQAQLRATALRIWTGGLPEGLVQELQTSAVVCAA